MEAYDCSQDGQTTIRGLTWLECMGWKMSGEEKGKLRVQEG